MKVLVTGAAGLVGTVVIRELLENGDEVRAFDMRPIEATMRARVETLYGDILGIATTRSWRDIPALAEVEMAEEPVS